mmetsp:Transcript_28075/g.64848  ORF Transcript_28075/g.64848 Transcript_28075/m.64848 type:complete len:223 (+) Transcript_28075:1366-2034(+)
MLCFHLLFLNFHFLLAEFICQALQHLHDTLRLELIARGFWGLPKEVLLSGDLDLLQEGSERRFCLCWRSVVVAHLNESVRHFFLGIWSLGSVVSLLLQHLQSASNGLNRLRVVLHCGNKVCLLPVTHAGGRGLVFVPSAHIFLNLGNSCSECLDCSLILLNRCREALDLACAFGNLIVLDASLILAPLGESRELHLFFLLGCCAFDMHVLQELQDLLYWGHS